MREIFSKKLVDLVNADSKVYVLSGDHGYALFDTLRKEKPNHFINAGVAEQNMVGVGSGMSKMGFYPIMYGLSAFVPIRVLEQIKIDFCYENLPGLFVGDGAGVVYSHLGTSHQSTEDIAVLRAVPNISILSPCDSYELDACFDWAVKQKNPVYLRMGKSDVPAVHNDKIVINDPKPLPIIKSGRKGALVSTGSMVHLCQKLIQEENLEFDLFSIPVLRPSDLSELSAYTRLITVEEHSIFGGLGDIIAGFAAGYGNIQVKKIGVNDRFSQLCGTYQFLMKEHGLDSDSVLKAIKDF